MDGFGSGGMVLLNTVRTDDELAINDHFDCNLSTSRIITTSKY